MNQSSTRHKKQRITYRNKCKQTNAPCWICGQPIDYKANPRDYNNPDRFQLDHYHPVSTHPHLIEDPANFRPSHANCNNTRGNKPPHPGIGTPSQQWT